MKNRYKIDSGTLVVVEVKLIALIKMAMRQSVTKYWPAGKITPCLDWLLVYIRLISDNLMQNSGGIHKK
jgi:hypothetical protein